MTPRNTGTVAVARWAINICRPNAGRPLTRLRMDFLTCERMGVSVGVARTADVRQSN